jgi:hypothetical protein
MNSFYGDDERMCLDQIPFCYDGKDTNLREDPYCFACKLFHGRFVLSNLKRCSRCKVAWYCSADCQKKHFKHHRESCTVIAQEIRYVEEEAVPLRTYIDPFDEEGEPENIFETRVGDFGLIEEAADYLTTRHELADSYWHAAYDSEIKEVWEMALFHYLELLRLDDLVGFETTYRVPFILLYLNRDDDAYAFIRHCIGPDDSIDDEYYDSHVSTDRNWKYFLSTKSLRFATTEEEVSGSLRR